MNADMGCEQVRELAPIWRSGSPAGWSGTRPSGTPRSVPMAAARSPSWPRWWTSRCSSRPRTSRLLGSPPGPWHAWPPPRPDAAVGLPGRPRAPPGRTSVGASPSARSSSAVARTPGARPSPWVSPRSRSCGSRRSAAGPRWSRTSTSTIPGPRLSVPTPGAGADPSALAGAAVRRHRERAEPLGVGTEPLVDQPVHATLGEGAVGLPLAGRAAGQQLDPLVHRAHRPDVEATRGDGSQRLLGEREVLHVRGRDDHALAAVQAPGLTQPVEALDLLRHPAHGLDLAVLVDRPGHGDALVEGQAGEGREEGVELGRRGRVALHLVVGLLEGQGGVDGQRMLLRVLLGQVAGDDQEALGVDGAGELDLPLHAHHRAASERDPG